MRSSSFFFVSQMCKQNLSMMRSFLLYFFCYKRHFPLPRLVIFIAVQWQYDLCSPSLSQFVLLGHEKLLCFCINRRLASSLEKSLSLSEEFVKRSSPSWYLSFGRRAKRVGGYNSSCLPCLFSPSPNMSFVFLSAYFPFFATVHFPLPASASL
ncbi:hypothetical protein BDF21DRAFT_128722 [Thamnidium elegans]|nr:hypothetical protein BDF21DRAFT_128722 [Thamnidium elegans]